MAVTQFAFVAAIEQPPVAYAANATFEIKTPSGSSSATTAVAAAGTRICRVATDTAVYVAFGAEPTASPSTGFLVPAGAVEHFHVAAGDKGAVITA